MIDKIIQTKNHSYEMPGKKDNINIKTFGDLHYFKKFDDRKLELISENLSKEELEYGEKIDINGEFIEPSKARNYKGFDYSEYL